MIAHFFLAAVEQGIVPGGGTALLYASRKLNTLKGDNFDQNVSSFLFFFFKFFLFFSRCLVFLNRFFLFSSRLVSVSYKEL